MMESERKLVTIRRVKEILPIPGADMIACALVDGWQVVVGKNDFKPGDLAVYYEIDSFLPIDDPRYEFLKTRCARKMAGKEGLRLRTIKLRGQVSQGLLMPINSFPEVFDAKEGDDLTERLNVVKYEEPIPACLSGKSKGSFPSFLRKTDEERIQNFPDWLLDRMKDLTYEVSVKMDGSSCTFYLNQGIFGVCSRNLDLIETPDNTYWKLARRLKIEERLRAIGWDIALQGEVCGEGIQSNREQLLGQNFFLFNIYSIPEATYLGHSTRTQVLDNLNTSVNEDQILHVPILGTMQIFKDYPTVPELLKFAEGSGYKNDCREGIVCKSLDGHHSFKVISNAYLLKHGK